MTIIYFLLILGTTVFIHELGHFIFAKKSKIYVYEFSLGMGPQLWSFKRKNDETTYAIRLFPIGGFVQMAGETDEVDESIPAEQSITNKPWQQKFITIIAGVLFNFMLAIIIFFTIALISGASDEKAYIADVPAETPAALAGLPGNSQIIGINGKNIITLDRFTLEYQIHYGKPITLKVKEKSGAINEYTIKPEKVKEDVKEVYKYGFTLTSKAEYGFLAALKFAFVKFGSLIGQMVMIIYYLFTGALSLSSLSGPVGIFSIVGATAKTGILNLIYLTGFLSLNVGFINLLPFPAFDGGRLLFLVIEKIRGKAIKSEVENRIHNVGFALLILLMLIVTYNDIMRLFK